MNQRLLCFIFVARKLPSLSMTCVHEKRIIDPKIAIIYMKQAFLHLHLPLLSFATLQ